MSCHRVWKQLTVCSFAAWSSNRLDAVTYWLGKLIRFIFFWLFITAIFGFTPSLAGYGKHEALLFFLTYNIVDVVTQAFFRGIYMLGSDVNKGNFDYTLTKPINPLFYSLSRLTDILDFLFLIPLVAALIYVLSQFDLTLSAVSILLYLLFIGISVILVLAIHIISAAVTIFTLEADQVVWLYRETMTVGKFPPEVLSPKAQFIFTYLMPIILIVGYPVKIMLGEIGFREVLTLVMVTVGFTVLALALWRASLKRYTSASS